MRRKPFTLRCEELNDSVAVGGRGGWRGEVAQRWLSTTSRADGNFERVANKVWRSGKAHSLSDRAVDGVIITRNQSLNVEAELLVGHDKVDCCVDAQVLSANMDGELAEDAVERFVTNSVQTGFIERVERIDAASPPHCCVATRVLQVYLGSGIVRHRRE